MLQQAPFPLSTSSWARSVPAPRSRISTPLASLRSPHQLQARLPGGRHHRGAFGAILESRRQELLSEVTPQWPLEALAADTEVSSCHPKRQPGRHQHPSSSSSQLGCLGYIAQEQVRSHPDRGAAVVGFIHIAGGSTIIIESTMPPKKASFNSAASVASAASRAPGKRKLNDLVPDEFDAEKEIEVGRKGGASKKGRQEGQEDRQEGQASARTICLLCQKKPGKDVEWANHLQQSPGGPLHPSGDQCFQCHGFHARNFPHLSWSDLGKFIETEPGQTAVNEAKKSAMGRSSRLRAGLGLGSDHSLDAHREADDRHERARVQELLQQAAAQRSRTQSSHAHSPQGVKPGRNRKGMVLRGSFDAHATMHDGDRDRRQAAATASRSSGPLGCKAEFKPLTHSFMLAGPMFQCLHQSDGSA